jgi:hypothetical protein
LVLADGDQSLAAEPGFHRDPPGTGGAEEMSMGRFSEHRSEVAGQQPENEGCFRELLYANWRELSLIIEDGNT